MKKYNETVEAIDKTRKNIGFIKEREKINNDKIRDIYNNIENWKERTEEQKQKLEEAHKEEKGLFASEIEVKTMQSILLNNLLNIQRELLKESAEILRKSKYYLKPFGEKTKEKIKEEIKEALEKKYNIKLYVYVSQSQEYTRNELQEYELCYEIMITYQDFDFEYGLKQEKIRVFEKDQYFYYYSDIKYTKIENVVEEAKKIIDKHQKALEKIERLQTQIGDIRSGNNKDINGFLQSMFYIN